ncbi:MAG: PadR family transcriptional regulator [Candidatus Eremiobacteraeota bacterium]|nr:PadR family transcriptional regulator [Candidatus Eremiobacteraeota bacterium]
MARTRQDPWSLLPVGASAFYILLALAEGERHGASIAAEVEETTAGVMRMLPGALYRYLKGMVVDGWIVEHEAEDNDGRRKYYRLTPWGRRVAQAEAQRLNTVVRLARSRRLLPAGA